MLPSIVCLLRIDGDSVIIFFAGFCTSKHGRFFVLSGGSIWQVLAILWAHPMFQVFCLIINYRRRLLLHAGILYTFSFRRFCL
jgi:hypothetical protein